MAVKGGKDLRVRVATRDGGTRLDKVLAGGLPDLSRSRIKGLILDGPRDFGRRDHSRPVVPGQTRTELRNFASEALPAKPVGQAIPLSVVYEDAALIIIDKPAGMVVHPAPGNPDSTLVNALIAHCGDSLAGVGGVLRPGIVHRLDKDTSGLVVAAKTDAAHRSLSGQFASRALSRVYRAVVWGLPAPAAGRIAGNIGRSPGNRKKMAVLRRGGRAAVTRYRVLTALQGPASLVECRLETGRTHQIRVHFAHIGHSLIGDPLYGRSHRPRVAASADPAARAIAEFRRQALHAQGLSFRHPDHGAVMRFESAPPADMKALIDALARLPEARSS